MKEELQNTSLSGLTEKETVTDTSSLSPIPGKYRVMRRNGKVTSFDLDKISIAMTKAFLSVEGSSAAASTRIHNEVESLAQRVNSAIKRRFPEGGVIHIEDIQDQVELELMRSGEQKVARAYVLYREERRKERKEGTAESGEQQNVNVLLDSGEDGTVDMARLEVMVGEACEGLEDVAKEEIMEQASKSL